MIPDFKTYLRESIWSDMQDRGTGDIVKKEDDINRLNAEEFYDYVKSKYNVEIGNIGHAIGENGEHYTYIPVLVYGNESQYIYHLCRDFYPQDTVTLNIEVKYIDNDLYSKLKERFSVLKYNSDFLKICPKGGRRIDNNFYIKVVEYIIDVANKYVRNVYRKNVNESIWSDMQDRGTGDMIKIEDDVNLLDRDGLYDYLKSHYTLIKPQYKIVNSPSGNSIEVPVFHKIPNVEYIRRWFTKDEVLFPYVFPYLVNGLFPLLAHRYKLKQDITGRYYIISPADSSSVTNKFFLEVLDFITEFVPRESRGVEKMVKESIWSDMQDRGTGDVIKKEDDIDLMDIEDFMVYLKNRYICTKSRKRWKVENWFLGGENTLMQVDMPIEDISEPGIKMTYTLRLTYDYEKMECIDIASSYQTFFEEYPEFVKYVSDNYQLIKKSKEDFRTFGSDNIIISKNGKELKFHDYVELIDKALSCVKNPYLKMAMNESIWSDMQERGTGDIVKREDDIDILDQDSFYKYITEHYRAVYSPFSIDNYHKPQFDNEIHVPFINVDNDYTYNLVMKYIDNGPFVSLNNDIEDEFPDVYKLLSDNYKIDHYIRCFCLSPLDGSEKITNTFYLNVLDFLIDNLPDKYLKAVVRK